MQTWLIVFGVGLLAGALCGWVGFLIGRGWR